MPRVDDVFAPPVRLRRTGRYVYLLGWERRSDGRWRAHITWVTQRSAVTWEWAAAWVPAGDLEPVDGQDYRRVPRRVELPDF